MVSYYYDGNLCDCDEIARTKAVVTSSFDTSSTCLNILLYEGKSGFKPEREVVVEKMKKHTWAIVNILALAGMVLLSCSTNQQKRTPLSFESTRTSSVALPSLTPESNPTFFSTAVGNGVVLENDLYSLPSGRYIACYSRGSDLSVTNLDVFNVDTDEKYRGLILNKISGGIISSNMKLITDSGGSIYIADPCKWRCK